MTTISEHISYAEAVHSETAIAKGYNNEPPNDILKSMVAVAENCFEPLRKFWNKPLKINSFYRAPAVNLAVNGKSNSQHVKGEAVDISAGNKEDNLKLYEWAKANLIYDQLIFENDGEWLHISFRQGENRNQSFNATQIIPK